MKQSSWGKLKVAELRAELEARGLPIPEGNKAALVAALEAAALEAATPAPTAGAPGESMASHGDADGTPAGGWGAAGGDRVRAHLVGDLL